MNSRVSDMLHRMVIGAGLAIVAALFLLLMLRSVSDYIPAAGSPLDLAGMVLAALFLAGCGFFLSGVVDCAGVLLSYLRKRS